MYSIAFKLTKAKNGLPWQETTKGGAMNGKMEGWEKGSPGGGDFRVKRTGLLVGIVKKNTQEEPRCFFRRGLKCFSPLRGTNFFKYNALSPVICFRLNTLKGTTKLPLWTFWDWTKTAFSTPKRNDKQPFSCHMGVSPATLGEEDQEVSRPVASRCTFLEVTPLNSIHLLILKILITVT